MRASTDTTRSCSVSCFPTAPANIVRPLRREQRSVPVLPHSQARHPDPGGLARHGADDYLTKPFEPRELNAPLRALSRRGPALRSRRPRSREYVVLHIGELVTRTDFLKSIWDTKVGPSSNVVDTHIASLRGELRRDGRAPRL